MVNIATLLFRIKVNNDKNQFVMIPKILKELVPADKLKAMSENEWKKVSIEEHTLLNFLLAVTAVFLPIHSS